MQDITHEDKNITTDVKSSYTCSHCNKVFKNNNTYKTHIDTQKCYSKEERTYCNICQITMNTHTEYVQHILSKNHIMKIGCNDVTPLNTNQPSTILQADPYLTTEEAHTLGTTNLGHKFTIIYNNDAMQTVQLTHTSKDVHIPEQQNDISRIPTTKQQKILDLLINAESSKAGVKILLTILDTKLNIDDYTGFQYLIKNNTKITEEYKIAYLEAIDKFIAMLINKSSKGEKIYKDKDISRIVVLLTM